MPIGSHLSVPVNTSDGGTYQTLCCLAPPSSPRPCTPHCGCSGGSARPTAWPSTSPPARGYRARRIPELFTGPVGHRLLLELTEHHRIEEPARLDEALRRVRAAGVRVAVDDAGSGYAARGSSGHVRGDGALHPADRVPPGGRGA
ncbi:MAG: EAL domain-containing protein [Nocardioides sp.]